jgi:hypothetical protein
VPPVPETCPVCGERDLVKPTQAVTAADTVTMAVPLAAMTNLVVDTVRSFDVPVSTSDLTRPLNLLHCVWTC